MASGNTFEQVQTCLDAMSEALEQCADLDITVDELWANIDLHCRRLAELSEDALNGDEDEDGEDDDILEELRFGDDESEEGDDFDEEDDI